MPPEQTASWLGLLDLHERLPHGWTLIGGQLVHLHCAERGQFPVRPTNDADTVIDVRASRRHGVTGSPTLSTAGATQALKRSETVAVTVEGREGAVRRPNLVGALVAGLISLRSGARMINAGSLRIAGAELPKAERRPFRLALRQARRAMRPVLLDARAARSEAARLLRQPTIDQAALVAAR
ncbi:MAG: periplasmic heavy metal sensor, partial [Proteobacteria bacterium]